MELLVESDQFRADAYLFDFCYECLVASPHLLDLLSGRSRGCQFYGQGLEDRPQAVDLGNGLLRELDHTDAAVRNVFDQTVRLKQAQSLTDGCGTDLVRVCETLHTQPLTRRVDPVLDLEAQPFEHCLRLGRLIELTQALS